MDDTGTPATGEVVDADGSAVPGPSEIPRPAAVAAADEPSGYVVWHRKHLRLDDHRALARAVTEGDAVCPLFVFDPSFYGSDGLACDARVRFLHEAVASLHRLYATAPSRSVSVAAPASRDRLAATTPLAPRPVDGNDTGATDDPLAAAADPGLTVGFGDPIDVLAAFVDRGWRVLTTATPTSQYGKRRDDRVPLAAGRRRRLSVRRRPGPRPGMVADRLAGPRRVLAGGRPARPGLGGDDGSRRRDGRHAADRRRGRRRDADEADGADRHPPGGDASTRGVRRAHRDVPGQRLGARRRPRRH